MQRVIWGALHLRQAQTCSRIPTRAHLVASDRFGNDKTSPPIHVRSTQWMMDGAGIDAGDNW